MRTGAPPWATTALSVRHRFAQAMPFVSLDGKGLPLGWKSGQPIGYALSGMPFCCPDL